MDRDTAYTAIEEVSGVRLGDILTPVELAVLPGSSDLNRTMVDRVLVELTGHGLAEAPEFDEVLKTYKALADGSAEQTSSFVTIGHFIDDLAAGVAIELTPLFRRLVDVVLVPVFHDDGPADEWCVYSPTEFAVTDPVFRPEATRLDAEYRLVCERLSEDYDRLESDPGAIIKEGTTSVARFLQIRTKDAKPYHPMLSSRLGIEVSDKTYGFYLTTGFLDHVRALSGAGTRAAQPVLARREVLRRIDLLAQLGDDEPTASRLQDLDVYRQQRAIYRNLAETGSVAPPFGVAQAIQVRGGRYEEDMDEDGFTYRYPVTDQTTQDARDVEATKNAERLGVPVLVLSPSELDTRRRHVRLATVVAHDDAASSFSLLFGPSSGPTPLSTQGPAPTGTTSQPFVLASKPVIGESRTDKEVRREQFRQRCLDYYGEARCAVCELAAPEAVDAAHLREKKDRGGRALRLRPSSEWSLPLRHPPPRLRPGPARHRSRHAQGSDDPTPRLGESAPCP